MKNRWLKILTTSFKGKKARVFLKTRDISDWAANGAQRVSETSAWWKGQRIGDMQITHYPGYTDVGVGGVKVKPGFKKAGVSSALFKDALQKAQNLGASFIRTSELQHPAQVHIRSKYRTKFIGEGMGKFGEQSKILNKKEAISIIKQNASGNYSGTVKGSTMIPSDINKRPDLQGTLRFIRKNGRIIPIRKK